MRDELIQYASTHAENKGYHLMTPPKIRFEVEDTLRFGEFGVTARLTGGEGPRDKSAPSDTSGQTRIFRPETGEEEAAETNEAAEAGGTAAISADDVQKYGLVQEVLGLEIEGTQPIRWKAVDRGPSAALRTTTLPLTIRTSPGNTPRSPGRTTASSSKTSGPPTGRYSAAPP